MSFLVLVRHGQSEWNKLGLWTGHTDIELSDEGKQQAREAAEFVKDITFHKAYLSELTRTHQTLEHLFHGLEQDHAALEKSKHAELNERHYGIHTGKNKWEVQKEIGDAEFISLRRTWDHPIPDGETLKAVHDRVVPFYEQYILADLKQGKNVIISSHGNTLRALMKYLDQVHEDDVEKIEIGVAGLVVYDVDETGKIKHKDVRTPGAKA